MADMNDMTDDIHQPIREGYIRMERDPGKTPPSPLNDQRIMYCPLMTNERGGWTSPTLTVATALMQADIRPKAFVVNPQINHPTSQQARNAACNEFLAEPDLDWLLMVDNDTCPQHPETGKLVNYLDMIEAGHEVGCKLVGAPVPLVNRNSWYLNCFRMTDERGFQPISFQMAKKACETVGGGHSLGIVSAVGSGVIAIHRSLLELVKASSVAFNKFGKPLDEGPYAGVRDDFAGVAFPRPRNADGSTELGEDLHFCLAASAHGAYTWIYWPCASGHYHTIDFGILPMINHHLRGLERFGFGVDYRRALTDWTMTLDSLEHLVKALRNRSENLGASRVLELGSGLSSDVLQWEVQRGSIGLLTSLENSAEELRKGDDIHYSPIDPNTGFYDCQDYLNRVTADGLFNCLLIDGPGPDGDRRQFWRVLPWMDDYSLVCLDDIHRETEQAIVQICADFDCADDLHYVERTAFFRLGSERQQQRLYEHLQEAHDEARNKAYDEAHNAKQGD